MICSVSAIFLPKLEQVIQDTPKQCGFYKFYDQLLGKSVFCWKYDASKDKVSNNNNNQTQRNKNKVSK
jgi:hypothetical protein